MISQPLLHVSLFSAAAAKEVIFQIKTQCASLFYTAIAITPLPIRHVENEGRLLAVLLPKHCCTQTHTGTLALHGIVRGETRDEERESFFLFLPDDGSTLSSFQ